MDSRPYRFRRTKDSPLLRSAQACLKLLVRDTWQVSVFVLRSILERIDLNEVFPRSAPLDVELGSGDGSFLVAWAGAHPERNFLGVERLLGRANKTMRKAGRAGLKNIRTVRIESAYFLQYLLPEHSTEALHIYFPDPWPKRKHRRHRLINDSFPELAKRALAPGGVVYLRTDDQDYFEQMLSVFANVPKLFTAAETPADLQQVVTDFERDFNAEGIVTQRAAYRCC